MDILEKLFIGLNALIHLYILYMEMFAWETLGKKSFRDALDESLFKPTKGLAANQGLYNGFLAAGLVWSFFIRNEEWQDNVAIFFLSCIAIAGLYGAVTASRKILFVQTIPAGIALFFILINNM